MVEKKGKKTFDMSWVWNYNLENATLVPTELLHQTRYVSNIRFYLFCRCVFWGVRFSQVHFLRGAFFAGAFLHRCVFCRCVFALVRFSNLSKLVYRYSCALARVLYIPAYMPMSKDIGGCNIIVREQGLMHLTPTSRYEFVHVLQEYPCWASMLWSSREAQLIKIVNIFQVCISYKPANLLMCVNKDLSLSLLEFPCIYIGGIFLLIKVCSAKTCTWRKVHMGFVRSIIGGCQNNPYMHISFHFVDSNLILC